jgi:hypothetical protein
MPDISANTHSLRPHCSTTRRCHRSPDGFILTKRRTKMRMRSGLIQVKACHYRVWSSAVPLLFPAEGLPGSPHAY